MKYHLILNPNAGRGHAKKVAPELINLLFEKFGEIPVHYTSAPGDAQKIAASLKTENCTIIAAGGDGTIHEIVNGIMDGNCILGIIPVGSGNDFVRMLNLPKNIKEAVGIMAAAKIMWMDIGKINSQYFPNGVGIGFDASVVIETLKVKKLRGFLIYLYSVFRALGRYKNQTVTIHLNGTVETKEIFMINVGNGQAMGGGFRLLPKARIDDGELDICIFRGLSKREVLVNLPKALNGRHISLPQVQAYKTTRLRVESQEGIPVHADGELISAQLKRIEIGIIPKALQVIHDL